MIKRIAQYSIAIVLIVAALSLLAFGPRQIEQLPKDRVVVEYWEKWTGEEGAAMQEIVDDFNNTTGKEKGIYVRYLSTSAVDQKTLVAIAAGVPPDIGGLWDQQIPQFAARNALIPLDDFAAEAHIDATTYKPMFWKECHYKDKLYGLVSTGYDIGLYYNKTLFRQAGLDPEKPPTTIAELDAYAKKLEIRDRNGGLQLAGYLPMEPGWYVNYTPLWFGGSWWDQEHQRFQFTKPKVIEAFDWVGSYSDRLGQGAVSQFHAAAGNYDSPQNPFLAQTVAMVQQGTFFAEVIATHAPWLEGKWGAAPFPSADPNLKDVTYCTCDVMVIPRGAKHPREAFTFMTFVSEQHEQEKLANSHCKTSSLARVSDAFLDHHRNPYIKIFERLASSPNAHATPQVPVLGELAEEMTNFSQKLALQQTSSAEGLADVQAAAQQKWTVFAEQQRRADEAMSRGN